jgi:hypothetical protein
LIIAAAELKIIMA